MPHLLLTPAVISVIASEPMRRCITTKAVALMYRWDSRAIFKQPRQPAPGNGL